MTVEQRARTADWSGASSLVFGIGSLTVTDVLQLVALVVGIACGTFSLYFHVQRFRRERKGKDSRR